MCGVQLKDRRSNDVMLMLGLNEITDQLAMANSVCWYVFNREGGLIQVLEFEVEGHMRKRGANWDMEQSN